MRRWRTGTLVLALFRGISPPLAWANTSRVWLKRPSARPLPQLSAAHRPRPEQHSPLCAAAFRKDLIAVTADIQQMFYGFLVSREHRDSHARTRLWQYNEHRENKK
jgi:hypothetical protein